MSGLCGNYPAVSCWTVFIHASHYQTGLIIQWEIKWSARMYSPLTHISFIRRNRVRMSYLDPLLQIKHRKWVLQNHPVRSHLVSLNL